jgi:glycosyltransferase involved in cell wall biosynthesis
LGFIHAFKNLHTIIGAMPHIVEKMPEVRLLITGSIQNRAFYNRLYLWNCQRMIHGMKNVELREAFLDERQIQDLFGAADLVLLPYAQGYGSASGVLHRVLGSGRLALCSDSPKFSEIGENVSEDLIVPTYDKEAWARRVENLLKDHSRREELLGCMSRYAEETAWPQIAKQHLMLYSKLVAH